MLDIFMIKRYIKDRKLFSRAQVEVLNYYQFAYCINTNQFVDCDITYNAYLTNEYIIFRRYNDGEIRASVPLKAHLPLDMLECEAISSKDFYY